MAELSESELRAILAAEKSDALAAASASKLSKERADAMDYYMGDVSADIADESGKSRAVSSDVADTIDGLMPSLMEIFCSGDEVVKFSPVGPEDEKAAEQETDYVNHVFMQQNPGFLVLYSFIKDALLQKVGVVKVWTEEEERGKRESYYNQQPEGLAMILQEPNIGLVEHTENPDGSHDITIERHSSYKCHKVAPVPPEEFGISRRARNIKDATYCFHECPDRTVGDLLAQGYDEDQVNALPSSPGSDSSESDSRDSVDEGSGTGDSDMNKAARPVTVTEHYIRMDYRGDGKTALYRVVTGGEQGEVLNRAGKPDVEEVDMAPFAAMTPVIITHRFFGRSIADLVMDIQRIKTVLLRGMLNNLYLQNNPRVEVAQAHASEQTLDDLLVSRPGGIVRTKTPGGITWQVVPNITDSVYPALQYMDATREWRTGVTRQGQGIDSEALHDQTATAASQQYTAAQARMKLIARIFAETGIKDLFLLLHAEIRRHGDKAQTVRLRNQWVQVDPRQWKNRSDLTIDVALGVGGKQQELANLTLVMNAQKELLLGGFEVLVSPLNVFNTAKELTRLIGKKDPETFFSNPEGKELPPPPPDPKVVEIQMKAQLDEKAMHLKAEIERLQADADIATNERKTQADIALAEKKFALERELKIIDAQIKMKEHEDNMQMKTLDFQGKAEERKAKAEDAKKPKASIEVKHGADELTGPLADAVKTFGENLTQAQERQMQAMTEVMVQTRKPRARRIKAPSGKVYEIEDAD